MPVTLRDAGRHLACGRASERSHRANRWRMRMRVLTVLLLLLVTTTLTGCELIGDIFQAGIWVGVIAVLAILALVGFLVSRTRRR